MSFQYNQYNFESEFKIFLAAEKTNITSLKNYLSDLRHFLGWLSVAQPTSLNLIEKLDSEHVGSYYDYLESTKTSPSTIKRHLFTVRKFCKFCIQQNWIKSNPVNSFNISKKTSEVINEFSNYLMTNGFTKVQITNYITDVNELFNEI